MILVLGNAQITDTAYRLPAVTLNSLNLNNLKQSESKTCIYTEAVEDLVNGHDGRPAASRYVVLRILMQ